MRVSSAYEFPEFDRKSSRDWTALTCYTVVAMPTGEWLMSSRDARGAVIKKMIVFCLFIAVCQTTE
jgi:hypothetical protein